ncbi:hypothetical protein NP493_867g00013 [Ridgeia piscesae]|uniref:Uncharacterized protein n=1 Tax=Ridgeia piscesae TaxID=27915 RepID=A0AAD9KN50_RIDPI|nr:hypothetical protein NP493_867g00013 [Ridgeia piscesae]
MASNKGAAKFIAPCEARESDTQSAAGDVPSTERTEDTDVDKEVQQVTGDSASPVPSLAVTEGDFGIDANLESDRSTLQSVEMSSSGQVRAGVIGITTIHINLFVYFLTYP